MTKKRKSDSFVVLISELKELCFDWYLRGMMATKTHTGGFSRSEFERIWGEKIEKI